MAVHLLGLPDKVDTFMFSPPFSRHAFHSPEGGPCAAGNSREC